MDSECEVKFGVHVVRLVSFPASWKSRIRSELSLPLVLDADLKASEWETRIILPRIDRDGPEPRRRTTDAEPDLDVPVRRRAI